MIFSIVPYEIKIQQIVSAVCEKNMTSKAVSELNAFRFDLYGI